MREPAKGRNGPGYTGSTTMISFRLTREELARIQKVATDQDRSVSNICRRLILRGLPAEEARKAEDA